MVGRLKAPAHAAPRGGIQSVPVRSRSNMLRASIPYLVISENPTTGVVSYSIISCPDAALPERLSHHPIFLWLGYDVCSLECSSSCILRSCMLLAVTDCEPVRERTISAVEISVV